MLITKAEKGRDTVYLRASRFKAIVAACVLIVFLSIGQRTVGHHSEAAVDSQTVVAVQGVVREFRWRNPHVYIIVETMDGSGQLVEWQIETGATTILARSGWSAESLTPGDEVIVRAHPARDGRPYGLLESLTQSDGKILQQANPASRSSASASSLSGKWLPRPEAAWPVVEALFSRDLPEDAQPFDTNLFASPATQCVPYPPPALVPLYLNEIDILDDEEIVYIRSEFFDAERVVYMDGRDHPDAGERTSLGHSIGRWDGDVLEVDTTLFADYPAIRLGRNRHLIERFELSEDGRRVVLDFTIEDPDFFVEPFSGSIEWAYAPDLEMLRYDCDPNVATQFLPASGGDE